MTVSKIRRRAVPAVSVARKAGIRSVIHRLKVEALESYGILIKAVNDQRTAMVEITDLRKLAKVRNQIKTLEIGEKIIIGENIEIELKRILHDSILLVGTFRGQKNMKTLPKDGTIKLFEMVEVHLFFIFTP